MKILLQGAMEEEIDVFLKHYEPFETKIIHGFEFYISKQAKDTIIISKTKKGIINATIATTIALIEFKPDLVINQGCAGGHTESVKLGDIVLGEKTVYINDFKSERKGNGEGSNSLDWIPTRKRCYEVYSTKEILVVAKRVEYNGNVIVGTLGSGDMLSREYDRINYMHGLFGEVSEDMESAAVMKVCEDFEVNRLAIRIISNNELLLQDMDKSTCKTLQDFVIKVVKEIINV